MMRDQLPRVSKSDKAGDDYLYREHAALGGDGILESILRFQGCPLLMADYSCGRLE